MRRILSVALVCLLSVAGVAQKKTGEDGVEVI